MNRHRDKGRRFERKVERAFEQAGWDVITTKGGGGERLQTADFVAAQARELDAKGRLQPFRPVSVQCKNHAILRLPEWLRELREDVLIVNVPRQGVFVVEELGAWIGRQS